jgi:hypothetical protein
MSNSAETAFLQLLFTNAAWTGVGDAGGLLPSAGAGSFYVSLHTADPGEAGTQATSECAYTGYARVAVARSGAGFSVSSDTVSNLLALTFGQCTAGVETATYAGIGVASAGATGLLFSGALSSSLLIQSPTQPVIAIGTFTVQVN